MSSKVTRFRYIFKKKTGMRIVFEIVRPIVFHDLYDLLIDQQQK